MDFLHTCIVGGGVVGDLAGFASSILLRGADFIQVPTTLLAQVDSSVGGKTAINTRHGKNLVGSFHQPRLVLADTDVLGTLPKRDKRAGYAEVVKYGLINQPEFFEWLEKNGLRVLADDPDAMRHAVMTCCRSKAKIISSTTFSPPTASLSKVAEAETILYRAVLAESANGAVVLFGHIQRERIYVFVHIIPQLNAGGALDGAAGSGEVNRFGELSVYRDGVRAVYGDAHTGGAGAETRVAENLAALVFHLHLLFRVAVVEKHIHMRQCVEGDLVGVNRFFNFAPGCNGFHLTLELLNAHCATAGDGLVAGGKNTLHAKGPMQRRQRHEGDDGGAVGVGNDAAVFFAVGSIDLRHHEWHMFLHAKGARIIHHDRPGIHRVLSKGFAGAAAGTEEGDVHAGKRLGRQFAHRVSFALEAYTFAGTALGGERDQLIHRKAAGLEHLEHFLSDSTCYAGDGHVILALLHQGGGENTKELLQVKPGITGNMAKSSCMRAGWCWIIT